MVQVLKRQEQLALAEAAGKRTTQQPMALASKATPTVADAAAIQMAARNTTAQDFAAKFRSGSSYSVQVRQLGRQSNWKTCQPVFYTMLKLL